MLALTRFGGPALSGITAQGAFVSIVPPSRFFFFFLDRGVCTGGGGASGASRSTHEHTQQ